MIDVFGWRFGRSRMIDVAERIDPHVPNQCLFFVADPHAPNVCCYCDLSRGTHSARSLTA